MSCYTTVSQQFDPIAIAIYPQKKEEEMFLIACKDSVLYNEHGFLNSIGQREV